MKYLLSATFFIVIGCFCLVFSFDKKQAAKTCRYLVGLTLLCALIIIKLVIMLLQYPLL